MVYLMGRTGDGSPREQGMGGVWEEGGERVGGGSSKRVGVGEIVEISNTASNISPLKRL